MDPSHCSVVGTSDAAQVITQDQEILNGEDLQFLYLLLDSIINFLEQQESQLAAFELGSTLAHIPDTLNDCTLEDVAESSHSGAADSVLQSLALSQGVPTLFSTSGSLSSTTHQQI